MTPTLLQTIAFAMMGAALLLGLLRFVLGPRTPDRLVAADTLSVIVTAGLAGLALLLNSPLYLDIAMVNGVLAFVAVVALARAIEGNRS